MPKSTVTVRSLLLNLFVAGICFGLLIACDQDVEINPDFSVNIFKPGPKWPNVKKLTPDQKQAYEKYGRPDSFHVYWNSDGAIKPRRELEKEMKGKKPKSVPPFSWLYLKKDREIVFASNGMKEQSIPPTVRIVAENGDPEDVREEPGGITQWMYYSTGKIYKLNQGGRIVEVKEFPAMGRFIK